ncbi:hypothetical protein CIG75_04990 [Tumebacillus algifaecis]|uniref:SGNH hydrolase-type esterase domain-containing protein n=1 Tax=Tumebacillus algifaecis TaxID=1214604 RepID=A0A223CZ43_9BACL|nr:SGNH/GDSL hydrolase family protein [Tumebacillus algifaecis]ASS74403.1 hypothetical protein CIG75_04990 [Tumebacillus algifaecis]
MICYTALGDSITAGLNATSYSLAYPSLIVQGAKKRGKEAALRVVAHNGWTSGALVAALPYALDAVRRSTTVTIWIGGNDLLKAAIAIVGQGRPVKAAVAGLLTSYGHNLEQIVSTIGRHSSARVVLCTQYNPFPNSPVALEAVGALNSVTEQAAKRLHTELAPVHSWIEGNQPTLIEGYRTGRIEDALQLFRRPIHPNNAGHAVIARHLSSYIR